MLTYDQRKQLYTQFEHSADVIQKLGKPTGTIVVHGQDVPNWADKEGNVNLFGVELEVSTDYEVKDIIDAFPEIFALCKKDSTITGNKSHSIEIVTIPASLRRHKKMWAAFFKSIDRLKFDTLDKHNNGMHIHVDRNAFEDDGIHLKKFCWFFSSKAMQEFNTRISERTKESIERWSKFASKSTSLVNVERYTRELSKYSAVNLGKSNTVEVRLFKGVVSFTSIIKNLEFTDAALEFTRTASMASVNLNSFLKWLSSLSSSRYRLLRICLEELDLEEIQFCAELEEFLRIKSAKEAFEKLKRGAIKFDPRFSKKVISGFNGKFPGVKLTYSGQKGWELIVVTTKFAKHDDAALRMFTR